MSLFDENAAVLRQLASKGRDLTRSRQVDFAHVFPNQETAQRFAEASRNVGFETILEQVEREEDPWDVIASKVMVPTCENISQAEEQLATLAHKHGGSSDGWGFFD